MRSRIRSCLLLSLLGALLLEALAWVRAPLFDAVHRAYPNVNLNESGGLTYFETHAEIDVGGTTRPVTVLDAARNTSEVLAMGASRALSRGGIHGSFLYRMHLDFEDPRFLMRWLREREPGTVACQPLDFLAAQLNGIEATRRGAHTPDVQRGADALVMDFAGSGWRTPPKMGVEWRNEEGRLVCRVMRTGEVIAGLGPDGYVQGARAAEGGRFGHIATGPLAVRLADRPSFLVLEAALRAIFVVSMPKEAPDGLINPDSLEPVALAVEAKPLHPFTTADADGKVMSYGVVVDRRVLVFLSDGSVIAETALEPHEGIAFFQGAQLLWSEGSTSSVTLEGPRRPEAMTIGIETILTPCAPDSERRRLRVFRPGRPDVAADVTLVPTRPGEVLLANLAAAFALLRPAPLALFSAVSPLPADHWEPWWWCDPWLAGGRYPGWLVLSLALAAFCALRARRAARERCATVNEVRFWTAAVFLLGPVGILWMRFVLPRVPVEAVGQARRAVNLDASPSTSAPWPDPKPQGIEVFS